MIKNKIIYTINSVFLGESGVGKTSIINRLVGNSFEENIIPTIAIDSYFIKNIKFLNEEEEGSEILIKFWDTAGQEKYRSVGKGIVQKADIIIFVRDNQKENFEDWFNFVENLVDIETKTIIYCLNKTDLMTEEEKINIYNELTKKNRQKKHHATVQCVSSKNSDGILTLKSFIEEKSEEIISFELQKHIYNINIILIGPTYVGKSSLIERIINNTFNFNSHEPTGGPDIKQVKVDLKNHSSINYKYIDVSGQESYISTWISFLDKADIIIFVNNKDDLEVKTSKIEERVLLSDKKIICCINKKDLFSDGENSESLKQFKIINNKLKDKQIILVSALTSSGIQELKNKINEYSINIIEEKKNKSKSKNMHSSTESLTNKSFGLEPPTNNKSNCCNYL